MSNVAAGIIHQVAQSFLHSAGRQDHQHLEVERKFQLSESESCQIAEKLITMGFTRAGNVHMVDRFLPVQKKGDMVRIREESEAGSRRLILTCKEWQIIGDSKERLEKEAPLSRSASFFLLSLARCLNAGDLPWFSKQRQLFEKQHHGRQVVVSLDKAEGLGQFSGHYLEIEFLIPVGQDVAQARQDIFSLAAEIIGEQPELVKTSYMEMLEMSRRKSVS